MLIQGVQNRIDLEIEPRTVAAWLLNTTSTICVNVTRKRVPRVMQANRSILRCVVSFEVTVEHISHL